MAASDPTTNSLHDWEKRQGTLDDNVQEKDELRNHDEVDMGISKVSLDPSSLFLKNHKADMRKHRSASGNTQRCRQIIDRLQGIHIPRYFSLSSYLPASCDELTSSLAAENSATHDSIDNPYIPLIIGLDRVIFGTLPASSEVTICGIAPPHFFWYMLSGGLCDVVQFGIDYLIYWLFQINEPSVCWALGFTLSIVVRHSSHRYFVFGVYVGGYWNSLMRMYSGYSIIIVLSTVFNLVMTKRMNVSHYVAWVITLLWTGILSYFILKRLWSFSNENVVNSKNLTQNSKETYSDDLAGVMIGQSVKRRGRNNRQLGRV